MSETRRSALEYTELGWRVVPIKPGAKHPDLKEWQINASANEAKVGRWYDQNPDRGVGIATGAGSDVWVLDVDVDGKSGAETLKALQDEHGKLPATVTARTGSGGLHLFFQWDADRPTSNGQATNLGPGLDVRGEGGQVVAAPTMHPTSGKRYAWIDGRGPFEVAVAEAPGWLYDLLEFTPEVSAPAPMPTAKGDSIAAWFDAEHAHEWQDRLDRDGWLVHSTDRSGDVFYTRPGKDPREGHSAVLHLPHGPFVIFSTDDSLSHYWGRHAGSERAALSFFDYVAATHPGGAPELAREARAFQREAEDEVVSTFADKMTANLALSPSESALSDVPEVETGEDDSPFWSSLRAAMTEPPPDPPTLLRRSDSDLGLFYAGKMNEVHAEPGVGKSWVLVAAAVEVARLGLNVVFIDPEDTVLTIAHRMVSAGLRIEDADRVFYANAEPQMWGRLIEETLAVEPALFVLDGLAASLSQLGLSEDDASDNLKLLEGYLRPIARSGAAVVLSDHVVKSREGRGRWARGSGAKLGAYDGAVYSLELVRPFNRSTSGQLRARLVKDRNGAAESAMVDIGPGVDEGSLLITVREAVEEVESEAAGESSPAQALQVFESSDQRMKRDLLATIEVQPGLNQSTLFRIASGTNGRKREILESLIDEGLVVASKMTNGLCYRLREGEGPFEA